MHGDGASDGGSGNTAAAAAPLLPIPPLTTLVEPFPTRCLPVSSYSRSDLLKLYDLREHVAASPHHRHRAQPISFRGHTARPSWQFRPAVCLPVSCRVFDITVADSASPLS